MTVAATAPDPSHRPNETVPPAAAPPSLLNLVLDATSTRQDQAEPVFQQFLRERSFSALLRLWSQIDASAKGLKTKREWLACLARAIATLDEFISEQVNAIIHHPRFQQLEASWLGLQYLVNQADPDENVIVRVLSASWKDLARDAETALEFDQSQLFRKVYSDEFGMAGGTPYGLLIGDYQIRHKPTAEHPIDDLSVLSSITQVAAAAFAPFITGAHPELFGVSDFHELERPMSLARTFDQLEYVKWKSLRESEDARFIGLTAPRVLMRLPYTDSTARADNFRFREDVEAPDRRNYLWGNAAYAFGSVVIRAFIDSGWLAEIRGVKRGEEGGGLVTNLPVHSFSTDKLGVAPKTSTDLIISDDLEKELNDLGFIPLTHCKDTQYSAFFGNQSIQKPKIYDRPEATMNSKISAMLQYILCSSRIAHYLKVVARQKIGAFAEANELQDFLQRWIAEYVSPDREADPKVKAKYPLREAQVQVRETPGKPGAFSCVMHLLPHYQLDALTANVKLKTELAPPRGE